MLSEYSASARLVVILALQGGHSRHWLGKLLWVHVLGSLEQVVLPFMGCYDGEGVVLGAPLLLLEKRGPLQSSSSPVQRRT
jgi:hypothetical protein